MYAVIVATKPQGPLRPQEELHVHTLMSHVGAFQTQGASATRITQGPSVNARHLLQQPTGRSCKTQEVQHFEILCSPAAAL